MELLYNHLKDQKTLFFSNQSGGGHLSTIETLKAGAGVSVDSITKDIFKDTLGTFIGSRLHGYWNDNMTNEKAMMLRLVMKIQLIGELLIAPVIFIKTSYWLHKHDIECVVNPQPASMSTIAKAVRFVNFLRKTGFFNKNKKPVRLFYIATELPTEQTKNYLPPLKALSSKERENCYLASMKPAPSKDQDFLCSQTGFPKERVIELEKPLVRAPFLKQSSQQTTDLKYVTITCDEKNVQYPIETSGKVVSIMLGSQAGLYSTQQYVDTLINFALKQSSEAPLYAFVLCGRHTKKNSILFDEIVKRAKNAPANLRIIPLGAQEAENVASLFNSSDITITRSGGVTSMELLVSTSKKIAIHSSHKNPKKTMPIWELGNFYYLQETKDAVLVNPKSLINLLQQEFIVQD